MKALELRPKYDGERLWLQIGAFLSDRLVRPNEYICALSQWMEFLGAEPGTPEGAAKFLSADYLQAVAFVMRLRERRGIPPRRYRERAGASETRPTIAEDWKLASSTIAHRIRTLRKFYNVARDGGLIGSNPFANVREPKRGENIKRPTESLPFDAVPRVIDAAGSLEDRTILAIMFGGGIRLDNVRVLTLSDVRLVEAPAVFLRRTKSRVARLQRISDQAAQLLEEHVRIRELEGAGPNEHLFPSRYGANAGRDPLSISTIGRRFRAACRAAGVDPYASPHWARKTAAKRLERAGLPIQRIRDFLGHASVATTEIYLDRDLQEPGAKALVF